jgi:hypothetical protein
MKLSRTQATLVAVLSVVIIAAVVVLALVMPKRRNASPAKAQRALMKRLAAKSSRAGAMPSSGAAMPAAAAAMADLPSGLSSAHPAYLVNGATANSEQPMPAAEDVLGMMGAAAAGEGPQTDAKMVARASLNLSDGKGIQFSPEMMAQIQNAADLEAAIRSDPALAAQYAAALELVSQRADTSGISRARLTREQAQEVAAVTSGVDVVQQGHFGGRSGAASAVAPERFASAVGESNLAQLTASRSQYDTLISKTLVAPDDHLRQAALVAMVHKVSDPGQRARLMAKVSSLAAATFKDAAAAEEGIRDGGTGYIGFTEQRPARGSTGSLGARYSFGDGGDLAPIIFNYAPPSNVTREQIQSCGFATHQAYEFASGRDAGLSRQ